MKVESAEDQLAGFIAKYLPEISDLAHALRGKMRKRLRGAIELVYDNYNALAIGFGPSERASEAIFSLALFPRWISLFFLQGADLPDPEGLLRGKGKQARHIVLEGPGSLDSPAVKAIMAVALERAVRPLDPKEKHRVVIKSISAKQRPRRPG